MAQSVHRCSCLSRSSTLCQSVFMHTGDNDRHITLRLPEPLVDKIDQKALAARRSRSNYIRLVLEQHLRDNTDITKKGAR